MIIGKLLGAVFGYLAAGPLGAIIGFIVGYFFDKGFAPFTTFGSRAHLAEVERVFFTTVFTVMGHLAKADGRISEEEISDAERLMANLGLSADHRREAIELFRRGAAPEFLLEPQIEAFLHQCAGRPDLKNLLLEYLLSLALADGVLHADEQALLRRVAVALGFSPAQFDQFLEMLQAQQQFQQRGAGAAAPPASALTDAYRALGVAPEASDREVKTAFRRLMSQHHPDKLIAQGVPADMVKLATEKTQEIQAAYDLIERSRRAA
jgi:DnaJ like chaperone protein